MALIVDGASASAMLAGKDADEHVRETIAWHFAPETGSPFWLGAASRLDFDPLTDIRTAADLRRFPDLSEELRRTPVESLIPRGAAAEGFEVFDSGGTTGIPKRYVDATSRIENIDWCREVLDAHDFPSSGNWLHIGPSGPHVVGRSVRYVARKRGGMFFTVDFDPRWVKKLMAAGQLDVAQQYIEHLLDQVEAVVTTQDIRCVFITPPMLQAVSGRSAIYDKLADHLEGVLWAGTAMSAETIRLTESVLFPDAKICGWYGNTIMGVAPQRVREAADEFPCVFEPYHPRTLVEIVDPDTREQVQYGERGRVLIHLLFKDMFMPNVLERDTALRVRPAAAGAHGVVDGIADVQPAADEQITEGVY